MCLMHTWALASLCAFSITLESVVCYRHSLKGGDIYPRLFSTNTQNWTVYTTRIRSKRPSFLSAEPESSSCSPDEPVPEENVESDSAKCDDTNENPPADTNSDGCLEKFRTAVENEGFNEELTEIVMSGPDRLKDQTDKIPIHKLNWFNTDDPIDSDDELLISEYCSERVPDLEDVYKRLDPQGIRRYLPAKITTMEKTLGRIYEVNQPLIDEERVNRNRNSHDIANIIEGPDAEMKASSLPNDEAHHEGTDPDDMDTDSAEEDIEEAEESAYLEDTLERSESDEEDNYKPGEKYMNDPNADPSIDSVIEDGAYRYFITLPMLSWTTPEKAALRKAHEKLIRCHKHYKETPRQPGVSSPYTVFTSDACSSTGVSDGECNMSLAEEVAAMDTIKVDNVELDIEEYKHSDLLNDIDHYEASEYPPIVEQVCASEGDAPVFTMEEFVPSYTDVDVVNPRVYVSVPKSSARLDEDGITVLNEQFLVKRIRDKRISCKVSEIPLNDQPQIGTILIPNEFGYLDQNIRYMADEIGVISRSLVFVPDISSNDLMFTLTMNRLIKLIQMAFNVNRIVFVALGSQGRRVIHYTYAAMKSTVERTLNDFKPVDPRLDPDKYLMHTNLNRLESIVSRQSTGMLEDIMEGIQRMEHDASIKAAQRARDYHLVKPLCNILQSIVLMDSVNVNFKEVAQLGVPVQFNMSNRKNLFEGLLRLDDPEFLAKKAKCIRGSPPYHLEMFDFVSGTIPDNLAEVIGEHVKLRYSAKAKDAAHKPDRYYMSTNHTGIDVRMTFFNAASRHFYMKKPGASPEEMQAIGNAILACADWVNSWSY